MSCIVRRTEDTIRACSAIRNNKKNCPFICRLKTVHYSVDMEFVDEIEDGKQPYLNKGKGDQELDSKFQNCISLVWIEVLGNVVENEVDIFFCFQLVPKNGCSVRQTLGS